VSINNVKSNAPANMQDWVREVEELLRAFQESQAK